MVFLGLDLTSKSKLIDIINKLESLVLKEIECISEFSIKAFIFLI